MPELGSPESPWSNKSGPHTSRAPADVGYDAAVLGGGICGATTALLLARAGWRVALVDAGDPVASSTTVRSTSKATIGHGSVLANIARRSGREAAVTYLRLHDRGLALLKEHAGEFAPESLHPADQVVTAPAGGKTEDVAEGRSLLVEAGFPVSDAPEIPWGAAAGYRLEGFEMHPGSYLAGVVAGAAHAGVDLWFHTMARGFRGKNPVVVTTDTGELRAQHVVIASHYPFPLRGLPFARLSVSRHYAVQVTTTGPVPPFMTYELGKDGTISTRRHLHRNARSWIVVGMGAATGTAPVTDGGAVQRWQELVRWADERVGVAKVDRHWAAQDPSAPDLLPMVGPLSPLRSDVLYASGFGGWGMTGGTVAAEIMADHLLGRSDRWWDTWNPMRLGSAKAAVRTAETQAKVGVRLARGLAQGVRADQEAIPPGGGAVVWDGLRQVAVYRHPDGTLHRVSARCTHVGCTVAFNAAERSWDCPCHGSRFGVDGTVLEGPATDPLERVDE